MNEELIKECLDGLKGLKESGKIDNYDSDKGHIYLQKKGEPFILFLKDIPQDLNSLKDFIEKNK